MRLAWLNLTALGTVLCFKREITTLTSTNAKTLLNVVEASQLKRDPYSKAEVLVITHGNILHENNKIDSEQQAKARAETIKDFVGKRLQSDSIITFPTPLTLQTIKNGYNKKLFNRCIIGSEQELPAIIQITTFCTTKECGISSSLECDSNACTSK